MDDNIFFFFKIYRDYVTEKENMKGYMKTPFKVIQLLKEHEYKEFRKIYLNLRYIWNPNCPNYFFPAKKNSFIGWSNDDVMARSSIAPSLFPIYLSQPHDNLVWSFYASERHQQFQHDKGSFYPYEICFQRGIVHACHREVWQPCDCCGRHM